MSGTIVRLLGGAEPPDLEQFSEYINHIFSLAPPALARNWTVIAVALDGWCESKGVGASLSVDAR